MGHRSVLVADPNPLKNQTRCWPQAFRAVHIVEMYSAIPFGVAFVILTGYAGGGLQLASLDAKPSATPGQILSFGAVVIPFTFALTDIASDYTNYAPERSSALGHAFAVSGGCFLGLCLWKTINSRTTTLHRSTNPRTSFCAPHAGRFPLTRVCPALS